MSYSFSITLDHPYDEVVDATVDALASEGFGVLTEIDVAATLKTKLDVDMAPYRILGACNPPLAHKAVSAEPEIGTLLPCNVVVRKVDDGVVVDFMDPAAAMSLADSPTITEVGSEVRTRLERVAAALSSR